MPNRWSHCLAGYALDFMSQGAAERETLNARDAGAPNSTSQPQLPEGNEKYSTPALPYTF